MRVRGRLRRFSIALILAATLRSTPAMAQSLSVRVEGDRIRIGVGRPRLLAGDPLQRLRDGASIRYTLRLSAIDDRAGSFLATAEFRFVVSYDIFEETFQVSRLQPSRVLSHLTLMAAETTLMEAMELPIQALAPEDYFTIRWEYHADDMSVPAESGVTLGGLVEIFSRKTSKAPLSGLVVTGPLRLRDLPRTAPAGGGQNP